MSSYELRHDRLGSHPVPCLIAISKTGEEMAVLLYLALSLFVCVHEKAKGTVPFISGGSKLSSVGFALVLCKIWISPVVRGHYHTFSPDLQP